MFSHYIGYSFIFSAISFPLTAHLIRVGANGCSVFVFVGLCCCFRLAFFHSRFTEMDRSVIFLLMQPTRIYYLHDLHPIPINLVVYDHIDYPYHLQMVLNRLIFISQLKDDRAAHFRYHKVFFEIRLRGFIFIIEITGLQIQWLSTDWKRNLIDGRIEINCSRVGSSCFLQYDYA